MIERVIYDYKSGKGWLLDLDSGQIYSCPANLDWDKDAAPVWAWAEQHAVDLTGLPVGSQGLYGYRMRANVLKKGTFATVTPAMIRQCLTYVQSSLSRSRHGDGGYHDDQKENGYPFHSFLLVL